MNSLEIADARPITAEASAIDQNYNAEIDSKLKLTSSAKDTTTVGSHTTDDFVDEFINDYLNNALKASDGDPTKQATVFKPAATINTLNNPTKPGIVNRHNSNASTTLAVSANTATLPMPVNNGPVNNVPTSHSSVSLNTDLSGSTNNVSTVPDKAQIERNIAIENEKMKQTWYVV